MSYNSKGGHGYGNQQRRSGGFGGKGRGKGRSSNDTRLAQRDFGKRSLRSRSQDLVRIAEIAPNIEAYLKSPNEYDWKGVDCADPHLIFEHKSTREKAADLSKMAEKAPIEVWIKDTAQSDIEGVDTPNSKNKANILKKRRFKIVRKEKVKEETEKAKVETKEKAKELERAEPTDLNSPLTDSRMPSHKEILEHAQQLYMKDNGIHQDFLGTNLPEETELREEGYLKRAQLDLMTKEDTQATRQVMDYVGNIRAELQKIGFDVVPLEGFDVSDLKY